MNDVIDNEWKYYYHCRPSYSYITFKNLSLNQLNSSISFLYFVRRYISSFAFYYRSFYISLMFKRFEELLFVTFFSLPSTKLRLPLELIAYPLSCKNLLRLDELGEF